MATAHNSERSLLALLILAGAVASFTACATAGRSTRGTGAAVPQGLTLLVRNDNWLQVNVYVLRTTARYRLGTVGSMSTEIFRIPRDLYAVSGTVQLYVDPVGTDQAYTTEPISIGRARQIEFTIAQYLPNSRFMLR